MPQMTIDDLCGVGRRLTDSVGEAVWDLVLVAGNKIFADDHFWTSQLTLEELWLRLAEFNPDYSWEAIENRSDEIRLYVPEGQSYCVESRKLKSDKLFTGERPFWSFLRLPENLWWAAPFACPYCGTLCRGTSNACEHQLFVRGQLLHSFEETLPQLSQLCKKMRDRISPGDFLNVHLEGIAAKTPRIVFHVEWFWQSYIYAESVEAARELESIAVLQASQIVRDDRANNRPCDPSK